jgi:hypothetical protein
MTAIMDDNFVVITGSPQQGKGERISKVRSHITKRYHRQQHHRQWLTAAAEVGRLPNLLGPLNPVAGGMVRELAFLQLDPGRMFVSQQVFLRMQRCECGIYDSCRASSERTADPVFRKTG